MTTVLFVPGFPENITSRNYEKVLNAISNKGFQVKFVAIDWTRTTLEDWVNQLEQEYKNYNPADTILAGFSFGAMTCLAVAAHINPKALWLFSLSPYFAEDIPGLKPTYLKDIGKKRVAVFEKTSFDEIVPLIGCPVLLFAGEIEMRKYGSVIGARFDDAKTKFLNVKAIAVPSAGHDVTNENYLNLIENNI